MCTNLILLQNIVLCSVLTYLSFWRKENSFQYTATDKSLKVVCDGGRKLLIKDNCVFYKYISYL